MASTARRIGFSIRSGRKTSREEDNAMLRSRKISCGNKISEREENTISARGSAQSIREIYQDEHDYFQNVELPSKGFSQGHFPFYKPGTGQRQMAYHEPERKISAIVYNQPVWTWRQASNQKPTEGFQTRWQTFLMQYERFILFTLALLTVSVSFYIFFVEKQSLFSNRDVVEPGEQPHTKS